ncbi:4858_t:CDS:10 [Diversispora eburnea]|uniref:4858_t:CDS:1 n=1 Tax=Diversispora eburnea TaxID=1213867 RepID=A0A9N9AE33_9GLOM|nr:4858_t:CDS:10 [Diversispora eburnea]
MRGLPPQYAHSQIELKISCRKLVDIDYLSKSDPQVILLIKDQKTLKWKSTLHKTEVVINDLNPNFVKIVDVDKPSNPDWRVQEFVGQFDCDLGSIGGMMKGKLISSKHGRKSRGEIIISAEEINDSKRVAKLEFQAYNILDKGIFKSKPNLFLVLNRVNEDTTFSPVYETNNVASASPAWKEFSIKETTLCNGDQDRTIKAQVKQRKKNVPPALGETEFTLREVISGDRKFMFRPTEKGKIGKDAHLRVIKGLVTEPPSFLDYISGGTQINLVVAIDFTGSNGDPRSKTSLHYTGGSRDNEYQSAIRSVGTILEAYDHDRMFPAFQGVDGILEAYSRTFDALELYGPTNFSPIINQTADKIKQELRSDMDSTVKAIINATSLPLSIIIVGVGNADFANMNVLDADDNPLKVSVIGRDIVQFVAMRDFQTETARYYLPKVVLEEIPDQFIDYMNKNNIKPNPRIQKNVKDLSHNPRFDPDYYDETLPEYYS